MDKIKNHAHEFSNYKAFEYSFEPVFIEYAGNGEYCVYYQGVEPDARMPSSDWLQVGTKEYINGWLYGAVQAVMRLKRRSINNG